MASTVVLGIADYATGRDLAFSALYLIPICWAGWKAGRNAGILLAVFSTIVWFYADLRSGYVYTHPLIPYGNSLTLLALYLVFVFLISAFKKAHRHLQEMLQMLQAEIAERKRLEKAAIQAERLATVGTMAAQVAHEVRNPLGSITLNLDLLQREYGKPDNTAPAPDEKVVLFRDIFAEIHRIKRVIEDYLKFARLPRLQRQPLALNKFLGEKLAFMGGELEKAHVKLQTGFDPALGNVNADGEQLWQATLNLIRNSMDAMPAGGELNVGTWREGEEARIRVADKGPGMNEGQKRHIFTPFFTTKPNGTGLGLALVQQIATEHGGHVECDSREGEGATFTIFLPLTEKS